MDSPEAGFEQAGIFAPVGNYALSASRHMHEFGTTSEQLAWIKVAASEHAQHNPNALLRDVVTVDDVLGSPLVADPLHRLDCCVVTDGGGALVVVHPDVARELGRAGRRRCSATARPLKHGDAGRIDLTYSAARWSGPAAFAEAGVAPDDIQYASIYDSFTITVLIALEDLGFCEKGEGGAFVADGALRSPGGRLPFNTDGGGLCNNHPANRGGMTKVIEAVRQLRGEAHPAVQVPGLRAGPRPRHRRRALDAPRQRHPRARRVGAMSELPAGRPPFNAEAAPVLGRRPPRAGSCCPCATPAATSSGTRARGARCAAATRSRGPR